MPALTQFLAGTPAEQPERYRDSSPASVLPLGVAQEFIAGSLAQMAMDQILAYQSAGPQQGRCRDHYDARGSRHFDMLAPRSPHWKTVEERIRALVR